jgi:hypothetical protein
VRLFRRRGPRIEVIGLVEMPPSDFPGHQRMVKLTDVLDGGELVDVCGVGVTVNEAARNAFKHAADLMFPPTANPGCAATMSDGDPCGDSPGAHGPGWPHGYQAP